ncbi:Homeobox-leucine zipper protein, partial [Actinidia chinensis var. chinensis]
KREPSYEGNFWDHKISKARGYKDPGPSSLVTDVFDSTVNGFLEENITPRLDDSIDLNMPPDDEDEEFEPPSLYGDSSLDSIANTENFYLELQEANNISKAAYKDLIMTAFETKTWIVGIPAMGSVEEFLEMFRSPPPPGMRVERSIESAVVPMAPDLLISVMMDVDRWAKCLSLIVSWADGQAPTGVLQKLRSSDRAIESMLIVDAELQLPNPLVQSQDLCFLRCLREIIPNVWAIVDISIDYFPGFGSEESRRRRRPSGLIIKRQENHSQIIWIENVEVPDVPSEDGTQSEITNSNLAFSAKCWVDTLIWSWKRIESRFYNIKMPVNQEAGTHLLNLTNFMRIAYFDIISESPDEETWVTLSDKEVKILRTTTGDCVDTSGFNNYIAVTSFRLQVKPLSLFDFLVKKNMHIQWPQLLTLQEPEEVIRFSSDSNSITLHKKVVIQNETSKVFRYLLQEASTNGFCSYIVSTPMNHVDVHRAFTFGRDVTIQPSGFAVMPDGPNGLHSNASLVTIAVNQYLNVPETDQAIDIMCGLVSAIIKDITEEVSSARNTSS